MMEASIIVPARSTSPCASSCAITSVKHCSSTPAFAASWQMRWQSQSACSSVAPPNATTESPNHVHSKKNFAGESFRGDERIKVTNNMSAPDASKIPVAELTQAQAKAELKRLAAEIGAHDRHYYQKDAPKVSDAAYDALRRRNEEIEARFPQLVRADSPSRRVGAQPAQKFAKVRHAVPMLSLGNAFSDSEVAEFVERIRRFLRLSADEKIVFTAEPK